MNLKHIWHFSQDYNKLILADNKVIIYIYDLSNQKLINTMNLRFESPGICLDTTQKIVITGVWAKYGITVHDLDSKYTSINAPPQLPHVHQSSAQS